MSQLLLILPDDDISELPEAIDLIKALHAMNHRVKVVTSWTEENRSARSLLPTSVELMMPFQNWSLFEMRHLQRMLLGPPPEMALLFYASQMSHPKSKLNLLFPSVFQSLFGCSLTLFDSGTVRNQKSMVFNHWLALSDLVVSPNKLNLLELSSRRDVARHQKYFHWKPSGLKQDVETVEENKTPDLSNAILEAPGIQNFNQTLKVFKCLELELRDPKGPHFVLCVDSLSHTFWSESVINSFLRDNQLESQVFVCRKTEDLLSLAPQCPYVSLLHVDANPRALQRSLHYFQNNSEQTFLIRNDQVRAFMDLAPEGLKYKTLKPNHVFRLSETPTKQISRSRDPLRDNLSAGDDLVINAFSRMLQEVMIERSNAFQRSRKSR